jgi:hypothetical protein
LGLGLIAVLLIVALVATGPLWAPLLPWAAGNDAPPEPRNPPVEAPRQPREPPMQPADAAASAALQRLDRRVAALETRPAEPAGDLAGIRQQVAKLAKAADLARRVAAIDRKSTAKPPAVGDIALVLALPDPRGGRGGAAVRCGLRDPGRPCPGPAGDRRAGAQVKRRKPG